MCNQNRAAQPPGHIAAHITNNTSSDTNIPEHVDHTTCLHSFIALEDGAVGCTICYWVWEVEEGLE
jgi:hypothetical protein